MTRAARRRSFLGDESAASVEHYRKQETGVAAGSHLLSHAHLTNCIHMHRHSPNQIERSLMRDLVALQRSRSLRDPSTSPRSWFSPPVVGTAAKRQVKSGRRSVGGDARRMSGGSPQVGNLATAKVSAVEAVGERNSEEGDRDAKIGKAEQASRNAHRSDVSAGGVPTKDSMPREAKERRNSRKSMDGRNVGLTSLLDQLAEVPNQMDTERQQSTSFCQHGRGVCEDKATEEPEASNGMHPNGLRIPRRCKFRGVRLDGRFVDPRPTGAHNTCSVHSPSLASRTVCLRCQTREGHDDNAGMEGPQDTRNVCGIPWNWSRIHHRGKSFLDMAGRGLSCGLSDARPRKANGDPLQNHGSALNLPMASNPLTSPASSDSEALPLLVESSGMKDTSVNPYSTQDYLGELGVFSIHSMSDEQDSDLASETRSGNCGKSKGRHNGRHQSLIQKYMPKTFKDLVGQNLVVQALSNAVLRKRVGLIYLFYGPHGTGKTSCARVFAKALNCQSVEHPKPCDACTSCISHNLGKSRNVVEVGPLSNADFDSIIDIIDNVISSPSSAYYRVLIVEDCDSLPSDMWSVILKVIDRAPRHVVFILICCNLDLPHTIISRCQKFFFPKLKESDIINTLQWISTSEGMEIDRDALKLVASRSNGSLRDAEMTLDQLSLLGQRISLSLVQELVGLVSDEKLVDLLDLALSADTFNTVRSLREITETGVEPFALMSQLATIITDILAGSYTFNWERRRKFFRRSSLSKEDMEKLRQALKTLSEAEKQLRTSSDKLTWLTAALLQLAPDQQYLLPTSSGDESLNQRPLVSNRSDRGMQRISTNEQDGICDRSKSLAIGFRQESNDCIGGKDLLLKNKLASSHARRREQSEHNADHLVLSTRDKACGTDNLTENQKFWQAVLDNIQSDTLRELLSQEAKLNSINLGEAPTVQVTFSSNVNKSKAEKFRGQILQAFESVLSSPVILEIKYEFRKDARCDGQTPPALHSPENGCLPMTLRRSLSNQRTIYSGHNNLEGIGYRHGRWLHSEPHILKEGEIIERVPSTHEHWHSKLTNNGTRASGKRKDGVWAEEVSSLYNQGNLKHLSERHGMGEQCQRHSLVRGKISLSHVINKTEGRSGQGGLSGRKAMSIAEKLEQDNLRLEPRSRKLLCWKASRAARRKFADLRVRTRRSRSLMKKLAVCGRCLATRSPR